MDYDQNRITYEEYQDRQNSLELQRSETEFMTSMTSNTAKISLTIVFAFIIIILFLISFDNFFDKKMRRITLIIAFVLLVFMLSSIFIPNLVLYTPYYYY